jgi:hypothetical protein
MAHPRQQEVRERYHGRCGYCGVSDTDSAGELTVDHYLPVSAGGDDADDNLVYACFRCNTFKAAFLPTAEDVAHGRRVLHPLRDDPAAHFRLNTATGRLEPSTETGHFHIALLHLNRPQLVAYRLAQRWRVLVAERNHILRQANEDLQNRVARLEQVLQNLLLWEQNEGG